MNLDQNKMIPIVNKPTRATKKTTPAIDISSQNILLMQILKLLFIIK